METTVRYRTFLIRPIVTVEANGRYAASAVITDPNNEKLTVGVDGNFSQYDEAYGRALEVAIASIDRRRIASDHHMSALK
jgi:hypothetical protein